VRAGIALGLVLLVAACGAAGTTSRASTGAAASGRIAIPRFSHVFVVVFENRSAIDVSGSPDAPTFRVLGRRYATLGSYSAVAHPSLPNYLALVSGSTQGITSDCTDCVVDGRSLADTLGAAHRSWKVYAEGLPYAGFTGASSGEYAKRHVPFLYFRSVLR
jgi:acid phosphatase